MSHSDLLKGRYSEASRAYHVTTVLREREKRYFADFHCARCVVEEMRILHDEEVVNSLAWVVMPDHVHWLFQLGESSDLSSAIKRFKARSAHRVNHYLHRQGGLWQKRFTITHCVKKKTCRTLPAILWPIRFEPVWSNILVTTRIGMQYGCRCEFIPEGFLYPVGIRTTCDVRINSPLQVMMEFIND